MRKRVLLVLGSSGLTGLKVMLLAKKKYEVCGTYNMRPLSDNSLRRLDITSGDDLRSLFREIRPDIVVNTAALHNVDYCETHKEDAFKVNANAVGMIADLCNQLGSRLIQISTDFVFDGKKGYYSENDPPNPLNIYAKSKLEGETMAQTCSSYAILRTSVIYGWSPLEIENSSSSSGKPINFGLWVLSKMKNGNILNIINDQFSSPTLADTLADVIIQLAADNNNALYHVSGSTCLSRYEFTRKIAELTGHSTEGIHPVETRSFTQLAKRPENSCLNCNRVQEKLRFKLPNIDESLAVFRSQLESECPSLIVN
jgi:dTDP-4-dehydrorhamnose reductase